VSTQDELTELLVARSRLVEMIEAPKLVDNSVGDKIKGMANSLLA
jgi:hypothetical protein